MRKQLSLLVLFLFLTGCEVLPFLAPVVTGAIKWSEGEAHKYYNYNSETIYRAFKRTCRELNLVITKDDSQDGNYYLSAGNNDRFSVKVIRVEKDIAKLSVRVNIMGDKPYVELIYKKVDETLTTIEFDKEGRPTGSIRNGRKLRKS